MNSKQQSDTTEEQPELQVPPYREVCLSNGAIALVDEDDFERVDAKNWHSHTARNGQYVYASCNIRKTEAHLYGVKCKGEITERDAKGRIAMTRVTLHQYLMGRRPGFVIDHKNGQALDCRRHNLRWATNSGNAANQGKRRNTTSIYRGVSWVTKLNKWVVQIHKGGKKYFLGYFASEEAAARVFDAAARRLFGEFARVNFPE